MRRVVVETTVVCIVTGVLVGLLWWLFAPQFAVVVVDGELQVAGPLGENRFAADAWFAISSALAGVLIALVLFTRYRHRPVLTVCVLAAAGCVGSLVAWRLGTLLGPDQVGNAVEDLADGTRLDLPLGLGATGVLLGWPIAGVLTVIAICLLGDQSRWRSRPGEPGVIRADRSEPWQLP